MRRFPFHLATVIFPIIFGLYKEFLEDLHDLAIVAFRNTISGSTEVFLRNTWTFM